MSFSLTSQDHELKKKTKQISQYNSCDHTFKFRKKHKVMYHEVEMLAVHINSGGKDQVWKCEAERHKSPWITKNEQKPCMSGQSTKPQQNEEDRGHAASSWPFSHSGTSERPFRSMGIRSEEDASGEGRVTASSPRVSHSTWRWQHANLLGSVLSSGLRAAQQA
jgi:hypothetical protein